MASKVISFAAFVAVARASVLGHSVYDSPTVHAYAVPAVHAYAAHAPAVHAYAAAAPAVAYAAPITRTIIAEPSAPANYDFGYGVHDPHTGDSKSQHESRRGDVVQGSYSLIESDGTKRTVDYSADAYNGFNAVVHKEPAAVAVRAVAPVVSAPVALASPVAHAYAAPSLVQGAVAHGYAAPSVAHGVAAHTVAHGYAVPTVAHGYTAHSPVVAHNVW
ncbi:hypothetical protein JTB14_027866 [Gonioctena quinquepunctata]|nr:hypothetical protein JTB14_027866 [Gonioctena quinquepunctata]